MATVPHFRNWHSGTEIWNVTLGTTLKKAVKRVPLYTILLLGLSLATWCYHGEVQEAHGVGFQTSNKLPTCIYTSGVFQKLANIPFFPTLSLGSRDGPFDPKRTNHKFI